MFLTPLFLIAAAIGASVPLILHLMQNKRTVRMPFPTLRFLQLAQKSSSRRIRMENLLLWLLRTLIMALLGFAFAMPTLRSRQMDWLGESPRDVAVVLDVSYSMQYQTGRQRVWDKAREMVDTVVGGMGENDRVCVYLAGDRPEALIAEPVDLGEQGVPGLKEREPAFGSSRLAPAVNMALAALEKGSPGREREVVILTDNQALAWDGFVGSSADSNAVETVGSTWDPKRVDARTTFFVGLLGVPAPENVAPVDVSLSPPFLVEGISGQVTARLSHVGDVSETTLSFFVNDEEVGRRSALLGMEKAPPPQFATPPLPVGIHTARVEVPDDNLAQDNAFHFLIHVEERLPTLVVGGDKDTRFIRAALRAGSGRNGGEPEWVTPDRLGEKPLHEYVALFLCNALPLSGQELERVQAYVKAGGLLVLFPGNAARASDYIAWTSLPGTVEGIRDLAASDRRRSLKWTRPQHTMIRDLQDGLGVPTLGIRRFLAFSELEQRADTLISLGADQPFLVDRPFGAGRVLAFSVSADRSWSDFPLSPLYLPMILQAVEYGVGVGGYTPYRWRTDTLPLHEVAPDALEAAGLVGPTGRPVSMRSARSLGQTVRYAEDLEEPGIYTLTGSDPVPAVAINMRRAESDLTPIREADVKRILGLEHVYVASDKESMEALMQEHRVGRTYGEHLLWIVLVLIAVEFFIANRMGRAAVSLSDRITVDAAGHMKKPVGKAVAS